MTERRLHRRDAKLLRSAGAVRIDGPGRAAVARGDWADTPHVSETVSGFEPFAEGDDPRKLDVRRSDLFGTPVGRRYDEPRVGTVLVLLDSTRTVTRDRRVFRMNRRLAAVVAAALLGGGHPVSAGVPGVWPPRPVRGRSDSPFLTDRSRPPRRGKRALREWVSRGGRYDHLVLVTDSYWRRRALRRFVAATPKLAGRVFVLFSVPDMEFVCPPADRIGIPGSGRVAATPAAFEETAVRVLGVLCGEVTDRAGGRAAVLRWSASRHALRRVAADPSRLFDAGAGG